MLTRLGSESARLTEQQVQDCCSQAFSSMPLDDRKVLVIIPDHTRTAPIDMMFRVLYRLLADRVELLDYLVALGTHPPMSDDAIDLHILKG